MIPRLGYLFFLLPLFPRYRDWDYARECHGTFHRPPPPTTVPGPATRDGLRFRFKSSFKKARTKTTTDGDRGLLRKTHLR